MNRCIPSIQNQFNDSDGGQPRHNDAIARFVSNVSPGRGGSHSIISTGFAKLDSYIGGFHPGELTIVASRPDVGKSMLALQFAHDNGLVERREGR